MLLISGKAKLYAAKTSDGKFTLLDLSTPKEVSIGKFDNWIDLFKAAAVILDTAAFDASLDV